MVRHRVLLTSGWLRSTYSALRNLTKYGSDVHISDSRHFGMSQFSRFNKGFSKYTSHYADEDLFVDEIKEICEKNQVDLIFPSHNETEILSKNRKSLGNELCRLVPIYEHCALFNNKSLSYDFAESIGIPVPKRFAYESPDTLPKLLHEKGPFVIKLLTGNSSKGVYYAETSMDASKIVHELIDRYKLTPPRYPQVEERVDGEGWGCSVLYWQGKLIADFTHRRLREKISTGGTSTMREHSTNNNIRDAALAIFSKIGWHGLAMCEFKVCPKTNKFWFIEVNPRMWGSIPLAINSGVDFPYLALLCALKGPEVAIRHIRDSNLQNNHKSRWLLGDLTLVAQNLSRLNIREVFSIYRDKADSLDDFYWDDPLVFLGQVLSYSLNTLKSLSLNPEEKGMVN
jgi:predicted ATP-grasp superfamily ATP-dependent carboligase